MDISLPIPPIPNLPSGLSRSSAGDSSHSSHSSAEDSYVDVDDWVFDFGDLEPEHAELTDQVC